MGGLKKWMPRTRWTYLIACCGLAGVPLLAGFFSKDEILWKTFENGHTILWTVGIVTALMTAFYAFRSYFLTFEGECRLDEHTRHHLHESPATMTIPLMILATGTILAGYMNLPPLFLGGHEGAIGRFLEPIVEPAHKIAAAHAAHAAHAGHGVEIGLMGLSVGLVALGIGLAYYLSLKIWPDGAWKLSIKPGLSGLYKWSLNRWYWDEFYTIVVAGGLWVIAWLSVQFDRRVIDGLLHGVGDLARGGSRATAALQSGQVQAYALAILIGANVLVWIMLYF
jgi:NADH-quinone oxidoreductase subunit L